MLWGFFALVAGLTYCVQAETNKVYQIPGFTLNTIRSLFAVLIMLPIIPFMEWPTAPEYYLVVILEAAVAVVCMAAQYNLAAKKNGRIACLHQPIAIILTFTFWIFWDYSQRQFLIQNPMNTAGIAIAFLIFIFSVQFIRKNDTGWSTLITVMPIAVLYSVMAVISKIALEHGDTLLEISLNFVFLCNVFMFLISAPIYYFLKSSKKNTFIDKHSIIGSGYIALFHTVSWVAVCIAIILTPNPAYVSVVTGLAPIWFFIYYKFKGIKDDASPIAGVFMAFAAILILVSAQ